MCYSTICSTYLCRRCTLIQYYVYVLYLYIISQMYMVYSYMLCYYMHLYSYSSLDLVLCGSMRYTIVSCLFMYDSLILYDCYILICLVYILTCVVITSVGSLPNIEHLFAQQCSMVWLCCQVVQIKVMGGWFGIALSYRWVLSDKENIVLLVWCGMKFYFVLMAWIDYPTHYVKVLDNRQVYDKQQLLCKQSQSSSPILEYYDTS